MPKTRALFAGLLLTFGLAACGSSQTVEEACEIVVTDMLKAIETAESRLTEESDSEDFSAAQDVYVQEVRAVTDRISNSDVKKAVEHQADAAEATADIKVDLLTAMGEEDDETAERLTAELREASDEYNAKEPNLAELCGSQSGN